MSSTAATVLTNEIEKMECASLEAVESEAFELEARIISELGLDVDEEDPSTGSDGCYDGKIYRMINISEREDPHACYIGSTTQSLQGRAIGHRTVSKSHPSLLYQKMREYGADAFVIELIEVYSCKSMTLLRKREQYWIDQLQPEYNMIRAFVSESVKETDYSRGKIYKLVSTTEIDTDPYAIYVGSTTCELHTRFCYHKSDSKRGSSKIYKAMRELGVDTFRIELLEEYPCKDYEELRMVERIWQDELNAKYNTIRAYRSVEDIRTDQRKFRQENREKVLLQKKASYQRNRVQRRSYYRQYYIDNRERILERAKLYRVSNRDAINAYKARKILCAYCDINVSSWNMTIHCRSQKHIDKANAVLPPEEALESQKVHCDICNVYLAPNKIERHRQSELHVINANKGLTITQLKSLLQVHCSQCNCYVNKLSWESHLKTQLHMSGNPKPQTLNEEVWCDSCGRNIVKRGWNKHVRTKKHIRNSNR